VITLKPVDRDNWSECIRLKVNDYQRPFLSSNLYSLAQAKVEPWWRPMCIYIEEGKAGPLMVGFLMWGFDEADYKLWWNRWMIDVRFQGKGYGRLAGEALINLLGRTADIYGACHLGNPIAKKMLTGLGFVPTGRMIDENEEELVLKRL